MGFGFGAGTDMQKTYHANIGNLKSKNSFKELRKQYQEKPKKQFTFNKMDPETYKVWKTKLADQLKREQLIRRLIGVTTLVAGLVCLIVIMT